MLMTSLRRRKPTSPPTLTSECAASKMACMLNCSLQQPLSYSLSPFLPLTHSPPILCRLSETISATNRMTRAHKRVADSYIAVAGGVVDLSLGSEDPNTQ